MRTVGDGGAVWETEDGQWEWRCGLAGGEKGTEREAIDSAEAVLRSRDPRRGPERFRELCAEILGLCGLPDAAKNGEDLSAHGVAGAVRAAIHESEADAVALRNGAAGLVEELQNVAAASAKARARHILGLRAWKLTKDES